LSYPHLRLNAAVGLDFVPKLMKSKRVTRLPARADAALNLRTVGAECSRLLPSLLHVRCQTRRKVVTL